MLLNGGSQSHKGTVITKYSVPLLLGENSIINRLDSEFSL